ncbi:MAG: HAD hydrolase-like protein [Candidatus Muiribacteriaceae bacterium]
MGPVTALLEYATGSNCRVFGKPSEMLFKTIAEKAGCTIDELAIVGDDIEFDILSPMQYGVKGIAVRTGKFIKEVSDQKIKEYGYSPDHTIDGIWQLDKVI